MFELLLYNALFILSFSLKVFYLISIFLTANEDKADEIGE